MNTAQSASRTTTMLMVTSLFLLAPAFAGQKPRDAGPEIDPTDFVSQVDNPYFPLTPGSSMFYRGVTRDGIETLRIDVTGQTKVILGVTTMVVIETAALNDQIIEIAENWFAQDREGNVWYFGEFTRDFENGVEVGTAGSWEAGVSGARPGYAMKAHPASGDTYGQEFAPGVAEDMASVISNTRTITVMGRSHSNVLLTKEWTPLESNSLEHKSYAPGVGLILEEKGGVTMELVEVR
jgi:hypothetical protein